MSIYSDTFSTGQVVKAASITNAALQTWIRRGHIVGHGEKGVDMPGRPGVRRSFTFFNVMEVATAAALIDLGIEPRDAFGAAHRFAHTGDKDRQIAAPFSEGRTLLGVAGSRSAEIRWMPGEDAIAIIRHHLGRPRGFTVLDASDLFDRVVASLGYHPQRVLDDIYSEASK